MVKRPHACGTTDRLQQPFTSPQSLAISDSREGTYYAMVQMENSNTDTTAVTLDVQVRGFEIREVLPALGGNVRSGHGTYSWFTLYRQYDGVHAGPLGHAHRGI